MGLTTQKQIFVLAANQAITSSTTLVDLTGLSVVIPAAARMHLQFFLPFSLGGTAPGFKVQLVASQTPVYYVVNGLMFDCTSAPGALFKGFTSTNPATALGATLNVTGSHTFNGEAVIIGHATTAGTVKIQVAQNVSDAAATTVLRGAVLVAEMF